VKRVEELAARYALPDSAPDRLRRLLDALAAEPDPPTTVREPGEAVDVHLADSLAGLEVEAVREAELLADLGSGAGFPGLPLAVALPDARIDLVESTRRKSEVIERLASAAGLANVRALPLRAEELAAGEAREAYAAVTARALAPLAVLVEYAAPLLRPGGSLVAWKGARSAGEERSAAAAAAIAGLEPSAVLAVRPYPASRNRHLHVYVKVGETPERFPRRPGVAARRPLA
jgi:16S rRNA (guanine527-N7)-methyltransferase